MLGRSRVRRKEDWYLELPPAPQYDTAELQEARARVEAFEEWTAAAILEIRYVVAKIRARGSFKNLERLIDRYHSASRQAFESRSTLARSAESIRRVPADLRSAITDTLPPDLVARLKAKAAEAEERQELIARHVRCHQRLVEVYSEALQGLAGVHQEHSEADLVSYLIGPVMGGALLIGFFSPTITSIAAGMAIGIAVGLARYREVMPREAG